MTAPRSFCIAAVLFLLAMPPSVMVAAADTLVDLNGPPERESPVVVAPMFMSNPAFGNGFGATGLYFYRPGTDDESGLYVTVGEAF